MNLKSMVDQLKRSGGFGILPDRGSGEVKLSDHVSNDRFRGISRLEDSYT